MRYTKTVKTRGVLPEERKPEKGVQVEAETQKKTKRVQLERKPEGVQVKKSAKTTIDCIKR